MDEFALIDTFLDVFDVEAPRELVLGPGDDCALLELAEGEQLCISVDSLVSDIHFPAQAPATLVGYRALAVSLSDLAAMGAKPVACLVALSVERADRPWMRELALGMRTLAKPIGVAVAGGNLANGPLNLTITVMGAVPTGRGLRRSGARPGDQIFVSGRLGEARLGLEGARAYRDPDLDVLLQAGPGSSHYPIRRYFLPTPRLELGERLLDVATAAIDLSDGLLSDLGHICRASGVGARLELARLPLGAGVAVEGAFSGDDYELCFTVPEDRTADVSALGESLRMDLTLIGSVVEGKGVMCVDSAGKPLALEAAGFRHFR